MLNQLLRYRLFDSSIYNITDSRINAPSSSVCRVLFEYHSLIYIYYIRKMIS